MPQRLSASAIERYRRDGFSFPGRVLSAAEAREYRRRLEAFEAQGGPLQGELRREAHLLFTWLDALVRHPLILDAVENIIGPNILCWNSTFFIKEPHDPGYVSWHQDATYWGLSEPAVVSAWVAFTDATVENGAMRMIPGSHREQVPHRDTFARDNILTRGQEIAVEVDEARAVDIVLRAGEMSLHHVLTFHSSPPNHSDDRRIGFAIRFIPPHVRQLADVRDGALLVRGVDTHRHFEPQAPPARDCAPEALAHHAATLRRRAEVLYRGTGITEFR